MSAPSSDTPRPAPRSKKTVSLTRSQAASVALKVALNERQGKTSPAWMLDVARRMGVQAS